MVLGIFLVGQFLEGNLLAPKLVGESVGLHPVWLIFALLAFGYLFGFVGLLVAVPLAATIGVLVRFALAALPRKLALYRRAAGMSGMARQSASARARARSCRKLRARGFPARAVECRGAGADRALAGLAGPHRGADRAGRLGQEPSRRDLGGSRGRARAGGEIARARRSAGGLGHRRAGARGSGVRRARRARAVSSDQSRARGGRFRPHHLALAAGDLSGGDPRSRLAPARAAERGACRPRRRAAARADRQARRRPPARASTRRW